MKLFLSLAFCFFLTGLSAQVVEVKDNTLEIGAIQLEDVNKLTNEKTKGSPYSIDTYIPAKVNEIKKTHFVRLNTVNNTLEVKISQKKIIVLDPKNDFNIQFLDGSNRKFTSVEYPDENSKRVKAILEVISENENYTLYKRERKIFVEIRKGGTYTEKKPAEYVNLPAIYYASNITNQSTEVVEIPRKKKNFFALFENNSKKVSQFVKQEKLSISENKDLIKIMDFYFEIKK
jgi:hypothetical protein